ncbi:MAG: hypothetical protein AWU57_3702 [Marinobacter sp. T13-3]|nr:MAG: hypothetical protein AWU57_3702 [Marinobacter sp. T13-3]
MRKKARISLVNVSLTHVRKSLLHELGFDSVGAGGTEDALTNSNARFCLAADRSRPQAGKGRERWVYERQIESGCSRPGRLIDNATVESFN